jgi:restriction system protein
VDEQTSLEKLRETGWKDFEYLVAEVFRRQGYDVDYSLGRGADGGVDLTLRRNGRTALSNASKGKSFPSARP